MSILDFFPTNLPAPREDQRRVLIEFEYNYRHADVIVIRMPTAAGKTAVQITIANWVASLGHSANLLQPSNLLLQQLLDKNPDIQALHKKDYYQCTNFDRGCGATYTKCKAYCSDCPYLAAKNNLNRAKVRAMNYYTYWAHRAYAHTLLMDEGHQVVEMLSDKRDIKLWQNQYRFPNDMKTVTDVVMWAQDYLATNRDANLARALRDIIRVQDEAVIEYNKEFNRGRTQPVLHICPTTARWMPPWLWPHQTVKKIVLLSATINEHDIRELGLDRKRVLYLDCDSPIPADRRRVFYDPVANMARQYDRTAIPAVAAKIQELANKHQGEKGLVHIPYRLAEALREHLTDPRVIWHSREDKLEALKRFKAASPESGAILVASGLYEGVDLPYDLARWQVIAKVPYLSLGSERIRYKAEVDPDWYAWETIKKLLQAAGRVCRTPEDFGVTHIIDSQFYRLWAADRKRPEDKRMFPKHFRDALIFLRN